MKSSQRAGRHHARLKNEDDSCEVPINARSIDKERFYRDSISDEEMQIFILDSDIEAFFNAEEWFLDGTFRICKAFKKRFKQLFIVSIRQSCNNGVIQKV